QMIAEIERMDPAAGTGARALLLQREQRIIEAGIKDGTLPADAAARLDALSTETTPIRARNEQRWQTMGGFGNPFWDHGLIQNGSGHGTDTHVVQLDFFAQTVDAQQPGTAKRLMTTLADPNVGLEFWDNFFD